MKILIALLALAACGEGLPTDLENGHLMEDIGTNAIGIDAGQSANDVVESCLTVAAMNFNGCMVSVTNGSIFQQASCNQAWKSSMASCLVNGC